MGDSEKTPSEDGQQQKIKLELADDYEGSNKPSSSTEVRITTGLDELGEEMEAKSKKQAEDLEKLDVFYSKEEKEPSAIFKRRRGAPQSSKKSTPPSGGSAEEAQEDEEGKPAKGPLKTFGHSSRPRRSVNYADIEKGADAQAQSLVTEFTTGKKRNKRTRDDLDDNYDDTANGTVKRKNNRQRPSATNSASHANSILFEADISREFEFVNHVPKVEDERPLPEAREIGRVLDEYQPVRRSSGGFRKFVAWLNDTQIVAILNIVKTRYLLEDGDEGTEKRFIQAVRHAYNSMPLSYRKDWEHSAKMDVHASRLFVQDICMPLSEIPSKGEDDEESRKKHTESVQMNCCAVKPWVKDMKDVADHFLQYHDVVQFFGCEMCHTFYTSRYELTKHDCHEFREAVLQLTVKDEQLKLGVCYMYLCCSQCGLWLPVKTGLHGMKGWGYFATALMSHTCQPLVPLVTYFRKPLEDDGLGIRLSMKIMAHVGVGLPLKCNDCDTKEFGSVDEAEQHFKTKHKEMKCPKCPMSFGTEFMFRHHAHTHLTQSSQFANYLTYSATYHPPPASGRKAHVGYRTQIPAIGGFTADEVSVLESMDKGPEFVQPTERCFVKKMVFWPKKSGSMTPSESESEYYESEDDEPREMKRRKVEKRRKKYAGGAGYSHLNWPQMLSRGVIEQEAINMLEASMDKKLFNDYDRLRKPVDLMHTLDGICVLPKLVNSPCALADDIARSTIITVVLPAASCVDPTKDMVLLNRIFNYCKKCNHVFCRQVESHCTNAKHSEDDVVELSHAANGPHAGLRCVVDDCNVPLCSIMSFRQHCALEHGISVSMELQSADIPADMGKERYDRSIMTLSKHYIEMMKDKRSPMARFTDLECMLPFTGLLMRQSAFKKPAKILNAAGRTMMPGKRIAINGGVELIKPYQPRKSRWFTCTFCSQEFEHQPDFVMHLIKAHAHICQYCGKAFSGQNTKRSHPCSKSFHHDPQKSGLVLAGGCNMCRERHPISRLFDHILKRHFAAVTYNKSTGEFFPVAGTIRFEPLTIHQPLTHIPGAVAAPTPTMSQQLRADYRLKLIKMNAMPVEGKPLSDLASRPAPIGSFSLIPPEAKYIDPRVMCYLCELTFDNAIELKTHLADAHPERWNKCPYCKTVVNDHFGLQQHLLTVHVDRSQGRIRCQWCKKSEPRFLCSHLLFKCTRKPCCSLCGQAHTEQNSNAAHMRRSHSMFFRRFQCSFCSTNFLSMADYYEHLCQGAQARVYSCVCNPKSFFTSVVQFCDHFDSMHVVNNMCRICYYSAPSQETLAAHRMTHMKTDTIKNPPRQVFILDKNLFPKKDSGYLRWMGGGAPPPSYMNVDRTNTNMIYMIDPGAPAPPPPPPLQPAATLFDLLEGSRSANPNFNRLPPCVLFPDAPEPEVIELSDDDDDDEKEKNQSTDDDEIVFEKAIPRKNGPSAIAVQQINSQIRVEQQAQPGTQGGYGGKHEPGYVVDDNELEVNDSPRTSADPVFREIVDENGDDDLAVVAEVENSNGTLQSQITSAREKKFKCTKCSNSYLTNNALQKHIDGHRQDAGATTSTEDFGLPHKVQAYICRNCCIAFENKAMYLKHSSVHGDTCHTCMHCSGIAFNAVSVQNHMNGHSNRHVMYGCGVCKVKWPTDLGLLEHLATVHAIKLFYFCKLCAFGSTDPNVVFAHTVNHSTSVYTLKQRFGAVPVQLLTFQPADVAQYRRLVELKALPVYKPSDCSHRSMLLSNEMLVACTSCFCTQAWFSYLAFNNYNDEAIPNPIFQFMEHPEEFPLHRHLNAVNEKKMMCYGRMGRVVNQAPSAPAGRRPLPPLEQRQYKTAAPAAGPPAPGVIVTPSGARIIRPNMTPKMPVRTPVAGKLPVQTTTRTVVISATRADGSVARGTTTMAGPKPISLRGNPTNPGQCGECKASVTNDFEKALHGMHRSEDTWFCRLCGKSDTTEIIMFMHYVSDHLTPAYNKHKPNFRAHHFQLKCPVPSCIDSEFMSAKAFERHVRDTHAKILPHNSDYCDAMFATKELQEKHDQQHQEYIANNGADQACCTICGTLDVWSLPKDKKTDCLQSHMLRHGLEYRSSCRACLMQFPSDVYQNVAARHMREKHCTIAPQGSITCNICGEMGFSNNEAFAKHCKKNHVFNILAKSQHSTNGELVVTIGAEYLNYVGLVPRYVTRRVPAPPQQNQQNQKESGSSALLSIAAGIQEVNDDDDDDDVQTID